MTLLIRSPRDLVLLYKQAVTKLAKGHVGQGIVDYSSGPNAFAYNNVLSAAHCTFDDFVFTESPFTTHRWKRFIRDYVDVDDFHAWAKQSATLSKGSDSVYLTKRIERNRIKRHESGPLYSGSHRWGNCLMAVTYRKTPKPTIALYSRTTELATGSVLDLTFASIAARTIAREQGIKQEDIEFYWYASSVRLQSTLAWPILLNWGMVDNIKALDTPIARSLRLNASLEKQHKYMRWARIQKMVQRRLNGEIQDVLVRDLEV